MGCASLKNIFVLVCTGIGVEVRFFLRESRTSEPLPGKRDTASNCETALAADKPGIETASEGHVGCALDQRPAIGEHRDRVLPTLEAQ
jgi:hypothetical protein